MHTSAREPKIIAIWNQFLLVSLFVRAFAIIEIVWPGFMGRRYLVSVCMHWSLFKDCECWPANCFYIQISPFVLHSRRAQKRYGQPYRTCETFASHISSSFILVSYFTQNSIVCACELWRMFFFSFLPYAQFSANVCSILAE